MLLYPKSHPDADARAAARAIAARKAYRRSPRQRLDADAGVDPFGNSRTRGAATSLRVHPRGVVRCRDRRSDGLSAVVHPVKRRMSAVIGGDGQRNAIKALPRFSEENIE